jgi:hypothetical protein
MEIEKGNGKIYVGIPRERFYLTEFVDNRDIILENIHKVGLGCGYYQATSHRVDRNRDRIVEAFLQHKETPEWLLMIDSDMEFIPNIGQKLASFNKPIVGALYFHRGESHDPLAFRKTKPGLDRWGREQKLWAPLRDETFDFLEEVHLPKFDGAVDITGVDKLVEVDAIGTGGILIHRTVLETIPGPWFEYEAGGLSEDLAFCDKAKFQYGFDIYCDFTTICGHYKLSAMGQTQFRQKYEGRGMQYSSYSSTDAIKWVSEFLEKPEEEIKSLFDNANGHTFGDYWRTLNVDSVEKERKAYRNTKSALPYMIELLMWNSSREYIKFRQDAFSGIRNKNIIDIGAGIGTISLQLAIQRNKVNAVEVNEVLRKFIKFRYDKLVPELESKMGSLKIYGDGWLRTNFKSKMDYAVAIDVFEHMPLEDLTATLKKLSEIMVSGGKLIYHPNWGQQDIFPMHHDYSEIWNDLLLSSKFYPLSEGVAQRM